MKSIFKCCIGFVLSIFLFGCGNNSDKPKSGNAEVTITTPDQTTKAFVWKPDLDGLGATISQPYQVWIQSLRTGLEEERMLLFEADKTDGVKLSWKQKSLLEICYAEAQISRFRNRFIVVDTGSRRVINEDEVEIVLKRVKNLSDC